MEHLEPTYALQSQAVRCLQSDLVWCHHSVAALTHLNLTHSVEQQHKVTLSTFGQRCIPALQYVVLVVKIIVIVTSKGRHMPFVMVCHLNTSAD